MLPLDQLAAPAFAVAVRPDGVFRYVAVNAANAARSGLSTDAVAGRTPQDLHGADTAAFLCEQYRICATERRIVDYDATAPLPGGQMVWHTTLIPLAGATGAVDTLLGVCRDLTMETRAERELRAMNTQLDLAMRCLGGAPWTFDAERNRFEASPNFALLLGEATPRPIAWEEWENHVVDEDLAQTTCDPLLEGRTTEDIVRFRFRNNRDETRWAQCRRVVAAEGGSAPLVCGVVVDVTDVVEREQRLETKANHDSLTGLLNRRGLKREVEHRRAPAGEGAAVLMLDLDGFKAINDTLGHAAGDDVLREVGRRLSGSVGPDAVKARLGGDEFVVVLFSIRLAEAEALRGRLCEVLSRPHAYNGNAIPMAGSVGLSWRAGAADLYGQMAEADDRLYRAKAAHRSRDRASPPAEPEPGQMTLFAA